MSVTPLRETTQSPPVRTRQFYGVSSDGQRRRKKRRTGNDVHRERVRRKTATRTLIALLFAVLGFLVFLLIAK